MDRTNGGTLERVPYPSKQEEWIRTGQRPPGPLTPAEKFLLRLAQFPGRMVSVSIVINEQGEPVVWAMTDSRKAEGLTLKANGS